MKFAGREFGAMCDRKSRNTGKDRDFLYSETSHFNKTSSGGVGISGAANMGTR